MRTPASGFSFAKRSRICASTGMKDAAHAMRERPASARLAVLDVAARFFNDLHRLLLKMVLWAPSIFETIRNGSKEYSASRPRTATTLVGRRPGVKGRMD